ncbi:tripartite tricarboxylate transporter substrate binding protein [Bordetella genomosp. 4]|uniref:tripartite tricarboxylate transporter substrate binding protein n=1 Tax=Bordetella genomosp. 4 TaxID=463044 RepID=UPI000B9E8071|nr:tripartite tricarboxylate transporter substrate binding protein [Bordetella genomosp. 4]
MSWMRYLLAGLCLSFSMPMVCAASYPDREVRLIVNYGAGGVTDVAARLLAKALEQELKKPVVVENKAGAQATLGPAHLMRQAPDGYTLGIITLSAVSITPHMIDVPYTIDDFEFIGGSGRYRYGLAVQANAPYKTVQEFVQTARGAKGQPLFFGTPGAPNNLAFFDMAKKTGANLEQVLYKSGTEAVTALAAGQIAAVIQTPSEITPFVESGKVRLLASVSPDRWQTLPDMPTLKEAGVDVEIGSWMGVAVPKGTPAAVRTRLEQALAAAMQNPDLVSGLSKMGIDPAYLSGKEYAQLLKQEYTLMLPRLQAAGAPVKDR